MPVKKILKKTAIGFLCLAGLYMLLLAGAGIYVNTQKERIRNLIDVELREKLHGVVSIGDIDISVWKHFPFIAFRIHDFTLSDSVYNKPILRAKTMSTTFGLTGLLLSGKKIDDVIIEDASFHLFTDSAGYSNKYLLNFKKKHAASAAHSSGIEIREVKIKNLNLLVEDALKNKRISLLVNALDASVTQTGRVMQIAVNEKISMKNGLGFKLEKGSYLEDQIVEGNWLLKLNTDTKDLSFERTPVSINGHPFNLAGSFSFTADPVFKLSLDTKAVSFSQVKEIVTERIRQKISKVNLAGILDIEGLIEGSLLPGIKPYVSLNWKTENSSLKTHIAEFTGCNFSGNFMNRVDKDSVNDDANSRIVIPSFTGNWGEMKLAGKDISLTNLVSPFLRFNISSECHLQSLDNLFSMKGLSFREGTAKLNLFYSGIVTKDRSMLAEMEGKLSVSNGTVDYVPRGFTFTKCNGDIEFYKDSIHIPGFSCRYLKNEIHISAEGKNIRRNFLAGEHTRQPELKCILQSPYLDLEDFRALFAAKKQGVKKGRSGQGLTALSNKFDNLIDHGIIRLLIKVGDIRHRNLLAKNFEGDIRFGTGYWEIPSLSMNLSGGYIRLLGKIDETGNEKHTARVKVNMKDVDVKKLFFAFDNFGLADISHKNLQGNFSTIASINAGIDGSGKLVPESLSGVIDFSLKNGGLQNFAPLAHVKNYVFKKRNLEDVRFAEIKTRISISGTDMFINRMEVESNVFRLFLEGNYGLKGKNTDLLIQVPFSNFNKRNFSEEDMPVNKGIGKSPKNIWLRAMNNEEGKVKLTLTLNPKLKETNKKKAKA